MQKKKKNIKGILLMIMMKSNKKIIFYSKHGNLMIKLTKLIGYPSKTISIAQMLERSLNYFFVIL